MPYAVVVSAFNAMVGAAFGMIGLQSWYAIKALMLIGASLGMVSALLELWRQSVPLAASVDEYRRAANIVVMRGAAKPYFKVALIASLPISLLQSAVLLVHPANIIWVWLFSWSAIIGTTLFKVWSSSQLRLSGRFDLLQMISGMTAVAIFGVLLMPPLLVRDIVAEQIPMVELLRMTVLYDTCVTFIASLLAMFLANALHRRSLEGGTERT
ncbi:hypothetical protein ACQR18_20245 [Bradyrhizobium oligotrophicum]|uniref:hypothetical protein n=1 Tax=Bradyrhizobium oligotrophicum TaxID=44255 RepID=UPI003EBCF4E3